MLLEGYNKLGTTGMLLALIGHWFADLSWFLFVSMATSKSRRIMDETWYKRIRIGLSVLLLGLGIYFLIKGI
jgi:threonine/homoserine/homoserine lactone efflux protein